VMNSRLLIDLHPRLAGLTVPVLAPGDERIVASRR